MSNPPQKVTVGSLFLDSGAHSLFNEHAYKKARKNRYAYFQTPEFWEYVDKYAKFVKQNIKSIDFYANVDVIHHPQLSWKVQKYLEEEHGLNPIPVVHHGTTPDWLEKYLECGYKYIALGGVALGAAKMDYYTWADGMFNIICPKPTGLPIVKIHGFAMTSWRSMVRYPWWSVDSASWVKAGGFGTMYVPRKLNGAYNFVDKPPLIIAVSEGSAAKNKKGRHFQTIPPKEKKVIEEWIEYLQLPLGSIDELGDTKEWGVTSHHTARGVANLKYFEMLSSALPKWPWPFKIRLRKGFFA